MIVYIEGVDGSGKSTLAKAISDYLKTHEFDNKPWIIHPKAHQLMVTHPWRINRITAEQLRERLVRYLLSPEIYIVDRGELSDIIYRTFDNDKYQALMTLKEYYSLYQEYHHRYVIIHCDSDDSKPLMLARGEDNPISISEHHNLRYLFKQIMPLFNAISFDVGLSIQNPHYLDHICANIRMQLIMKSNSFPTGDIYD
jgi:energy-coupling factor transporter ATP-binding protein EcfA2